METARLRRFAQFARRALKDQIEAKLTFVESLDSPTRREHPEAMRKLEDAINELGRSQLLERVAQSLFVHSPEGSHFDQK